MRLGMLKKLRPETREAARAAARRSGRSVEEWLNSVVAQSAAHAELDAVLFGDDNDADVQERLDELSRRIDRLARQNPPPAPQKTTHDTDELAKIVTRLDRRLDHFVQFAHSLPSMAGSWQPAVVDRAAAEIAARQRTLRGEAPVPPAMVPPAMPPVAMAQQPGPSHPATAYAPMPQPGIAQYGAPPSAMPQYGMAQATMQQATMQQAMPQPAMPRYAPQHPSPAAMPVVPPSIFAPPGASPMPAAPPQQTLAAQVDAQYAHAAGYASPGATQQPLQQPAPAAPFSPQPQPQRAAYAPPRMQPQPQTPPPPAPDLSRLEKQLRAITDQIETLRKPGIEDAINALRAELKQIAQALTEALPRHVIDAVENQIQTLTRRLSEGRQAGIGEDVLISIEQHLGEVRDALRQLTPAEHLIGFNDTVEALAQRIEEIVAQRDPVSFHQFEDAVNNLRAVSTHIASNDAVSQLAAQVEALAAKIDQIAYTSSGDAALAHIEQRIGELTDAISARNQNGGAVPQHLEMLVGSLNDKIEQIQASRGDGLAFSQLEDRIVRLAEKLDASDSRFANLEAVERGLADLLSQTENQQRREPPPQSSANEHVDALRLDVARTQDSLEAVHSTLGILVDRLAIIETGIRTQAEAPPAQPHLPPAPSLQPVDTMVAQVATATARLQAQAGADPAVRHGPHLPATDAPPLAPAHAQSAQAQPAAPPLPSRRNRPINPDLPPDHPIEPGMARATGARSTDPESPAARIAASEAALGVARPPLIADPGSRSDFIAAARRAARAAEHAAATPHPDPRQENGAASRRLLSAPAAVFAVLRPKLKSLLVASSVVAIVVGGYYLIGSMLGDKTSSVAPLPAGLLGGSKPASEPPPGLYEDLEPEREQNTDAAAPEKHSNFLLAPNSTMQNAPGLSSAISSAMAATPAKPHDVTGAIDPGARIVYPETLPEAIGSAGLRDAALRGDAGAAYEIASRYAEGRGVPHSSEDAVRWLDRAAQKGIAVAQFRLGSMYEKGSGVRRDLKEARRLYKAAADQGHAKAMHNLAVLYAEGIDGKPDYNAASQLFQKAADYGVRDSQYNLGILYARGLGVGRDLSTSYKWFSLAAAQGDKEAAKKRDELSNHIDPAVRASAENATKSWAPHLQPQQAIRIPSPPGGWDRTASTAPESSNEGQAKDWTKTLANDWARTQADTADAATTSLENSPAGATRDTAKTATRTPTKPRRPSTQASHGPLQLTTQ
jgi:localization factor PodJL